MSNDSIVTYSKGTADHLWYCEVQLGALAGTWLGPFHTKQAAKEYVNQMLQVAAKVSLN